MAVATMAGVYPSNGAIHAMQALMPQASSSSLAASLEGTATAVPFSGSPTGKGQGTGCHKTGMTRA